MTITWRVKLITRQITPFFQLLIEVYPLVYFISIFQDLQNSISWGPLYYVPHCIMFWSVKFAHLHAKDDAYKATNIDNFMLQKITNFHCATCFVPNLILIGP